MERVMPSSIDYSRVLPLSIPAIARRKKFYPANGTAFNFLGSNEIRIQVGSANALLDPTHSYIECEVVNANAAQTFGFDMGGLSTMFSDVIIEQGGRVLSHCHEYNRLHSSVLAPAQTSKDGKATESLTGAGRAYNGVGVLSVAPRGVGGTGESYSNQAHNTDAFLPAGGGLRMTLGLTTGLFSQDKLIPLPLINPNEPITIVLRVASSDMPGCWNGAPAVGDLQVINVSYNAHLIEVGRDVIDQFRGVQEDMGGQLVISGQDWEYGAGNVPAASAGELPIRMPTRKRSIKSMFWTCTDNSYAGGAGINEALCFNLSYAGNCNVDSWQLKVGSVTYPPTPIAGWGDVAIAGATPAVMQRGESAMELAKAFGTLGYTNPTGYLSTITYGTDAAGALANGDNTDGAGADLVAASGGVINVCPFGIDLEAVQRTAIESGIDTETLSQETNLILNINAVGASPAALAAHDKVLNMWMLYDQHYYFNRDGSITFSN